MPSRSLWKWAVVAAIVLLGIGAAVVRFTGGSSNESGTTATQGVVCFGRVDLEDGCSSLGFQQPGRVTRVNVHEGDKVADGAVLAEQEDTTAKLQEQEAQAGYDAARAQVELARQGIPRLAALLDAQEAAVTAAKSRLAQAQEIFNRKKDLHGKNLIDISEVNIASQQVNEAKASVAAEQARKKELEEQRPEQVLERARSDEAVAQARLQLANESRRQRSLRAPCAGTVVRVLVSQGDELSAPVTRPAILFAPARPLIVRAEIEQEFAPRVKLHQAVKVVDEINPQVAWRGHVDRISDWFLARRNILLEPTRYNDARTLEGIISLEPAEVPPRLGQQVRVLIDVPD
jgi:multidrug resistance efflux pump